MSQCSCGAGCSFPNFTFAEILKSLFYGPSSSQISITLACSACGLPLISKVMTSIGLTSQLYRNSKMIFMVQMSKEFLLIPFLNQKDVITLHTIWWPQLHSTFNQPQVSPIYFLIFLWSSASFSFILSLFKTNNTHFATNIWKNVRNHNLQVAGLLL